MQTFVRQVTLAQVYRRVSRLLRIGFKNIPSIVCLQNFCIIAYNVNMKYSIFSILFVAGICATAHAQDHVKESNSSTGIVDSGEPSPAAQQVGLAILRSKKLLDLDNMIGFVSGNSLKRRKFLQGKLIKTQLDVKTLAEAEGIVDDFIEQIAGVPKKDQGTLYVADQKLKALRDAIAQTKQLFETSQKVYAQNWSSDAPLEIISSLEMFLSGRGLSPKQIYGSPGLDGRRD